MADTRNGFSIAPVLLAVVSLSVLMASLISPSAKHPAAYALVPFAPLFAAAPWSPRARYYLRLAAFVAGLGVCSVWGVASAVVAGIFRPSWRRNVQWWVARSFYYLTGPLLGWDFEVEGEEHLEAASRGVPHILVGNHQSMIDILYIGRIFPKTCVVMAKKELKYTPLLGQYMALSHTVFVDRANRIGAVAAFRKVASEMKRIGLNLFIFAEGTRSASSVPALLPFKKGPFHLAIEAQLPIIPIVCENYYSLYSTWPSSRFESGKPVIKVLPPVETSGYAHGSSEDAGKLAEEVRKRMLEALLELAERKGAVSGRFEGTKEDAERVRALVGAGKKNI